MKILLINTFDRGGAANSAIRLHNGLLNENIESRMLLKIKSKDLHNTFDFDIKLTFINIQVERIKKILNRLDFKKICREKILNNRPNGLELFSFPSSKIDITNSILYKNSEIIHLHWVANFLDWKTFFRKNKKPIVWTLHDENPFLGGEHYDERFLGINEFGNPIKRIKNKNEILTEIKLKSQKMKYLESAKNVYIVCPSLWLLNKSKKSEIFKNIPHFHIPYGFPTNVFKPLDKDFCRSIFGIETNKKIMLFVADSQINNRKGMSYLSRAIEELNLEPGFEIICCTIGSGTILSQSENILNLGKIEDEKLMAIAYNLADVFIIPSLEDNLPNTMIESILCGTPVIGFNSGGISEVIINGENGWLCPEISVSSLKTTIKKYLLKGVSQSHSEISERARSKYSLEIQALEYVKLYEKILYKNEVGFKEPI